MTLPNEDRKKLNRCLVRFQAGDPDAADEFHSLVRPYLINLARRIAPDLPFDLHDEVAQQTCLNLLGNSVMKFNPRRGTAKKFLVLAVRNAIREVRSLYCPPGTTTRPAKTSSDDKTTRARPISIEELSEADYVSTPGDDVPVRCEVNSALRLATPQVAVALERIYYSGDKLVEVAEDLKVSRYKLSREISTFCKRMQIIAQFGKVTLADRMTC